MVSSGFIWAKYFDNDYYFSSYTTVRSSERGGYNDIENVSNNKEHLIVVSIVNYDVVT